MTNNDPTIQTMLFLDGRCDEALDFYKTALGAEVIMLMRNKDNPEPAAEGCPNMPADKVMHAQFRIGNTVVMACDGRCGGKPVFEGFGLTLNVIRRIVRGRRGDDAAGEDLFLTPFRHGDRPIRRLVDDPHDAPRLGSKPSTHPTTNTNDEHI
jgi:hypothetical protein